MSLAEQLAAYLSRTSGTPTAVEGLARISGGASRETYRFEAIAKGQRKPLILRRDPPGSLIETDRRIEFLAIRSFAGKNVAAPQALALEEEGAELERPFFIMDRAEGVTGTIFSADPYGRHAGAIGEQFFSMMGRIAAEPVAGLPILEACAMPEPGQCARRELDYWAGVIDADEQHPQPIVRAAIRRLYRALPPAPAKIAVVHGDFRSGNFLHDGAVRITAVLDWEMAHLGDPLEDLAWASDPLWSSPPGDARISGMVGLEDGLAIWRRASGLDVEPAAFSWWRLFAAVKEGQARSGPRPPRRGATADRASRSSPSPAGTPPDATTRSSPKFCRPTRGPSDARPTRAHRRLRDRARRSSAAGGGADYAAGGAHRSLITTLLALAGYEAERAAAATAAENAAIGKVLRDAAPAYGAELGGRLAGGAVCVTVEGALPALDAANADLRRLLIDLHAAAEARPDARLDREILDLYREMAAGRRLDLAAALGR